jgi:hypothetical protein
VIVTEVAMKAGSTRGQGYSGGYLGSREDGKLKAVVA